MEFGIELNDRPFFLGNINKAITYLHYRGIRVTLSPVNDDGFTAYLNGLKPLKDYFNCGARFTIFITFGCSTHLTTEVVPYGV